MDETCLPFLLGLKQDIELVGFLVLDVLQILRAVLLYLRAVGQYWTFIFGKIFDGGSWLAGKIEGLISRLEKLAEAVNGKYDVTGIARRTGQRVLGAIDSAGGAVGNAAEGVTQRLFGGTPTIPMSPAPVMQSKSITASYAPTIIQQPGQSATDVANESQRLWSEWMSNEVESASAAVTK